MFFQSWYVNKSKDQKRDIYTCAPPGANSAKLRQVSAAADFGQSSRKAGRKLKSYTTTHRRCWCSKTKMKHLKSCWSPCFWHDNVRDGSIAVGLYSIGISICIITFTIYLLLGGDTSQLWLPFFETGKSNWIWLVHNVGVYWNNPPLERQFWESRPPRKIFEGTIFGVHTGAGL